jgi:hypothetical protein
MNTVTKTQETNVVQFKNIGHFIEQLTEFAGKHKGYVAIRAEGPEQWFASLIFKEQGRTLEKEGDTFNTAVLSLWRAAVRIGR